MTSYMSGLSPLCLTSMCGLEVRVFAPGGTGAGLTGHPGATPTGTLAKESLCLTEIVSSSTVMTGSGGMLNVITLLESSVA